MRHLFRTIAVAVSLFSPLFAHANPDSTYASLRAARPDGRVIALDGFTFQRDVLTFTLNGRLHLLTEVDGTTSGAVFLGRGSYELKPATQSELQHLALRTQDDDLKSVADEFDSAVFLGTALVAAATANGTPIQTTTPEQAAIERWETYLKRQTRDLHTNLHVRLLQEKLDDREPFFFAWIDGKKYPPAALVVDPRGAEAVRLAGRDLGGEQTMMYVLHDTKGGIWYSSRYAAEVQNRHGALVLPVADADHYEIDADIRGSELTATSTMTFSVYAPTRVLPIDLSGKLRIESVSLAVAGEQPAFADVPFVQEHEDPDAVVIFPAPLERRKKYLLRIAYGGRDVLENAGDGNFTVSRRANWYPNVGVFSDLATYGLRFRTPQKFQIVATGKEIENRVEGDLRIATWRAELPVRVAGFNYGRFRKLAQADPDSGMTFEVYTNPGTPDIISQINIALSASRHIQEASTMPDHIRVDTESLAQSALADGINTARTASVFFGAIPTKQVAITQQSQWFFGQSWPSLIYMPYVAFLNGTVRHFLGLTGTQEFVDNVGPHELAHQWWGHHVGFRSYRDEWLSEGFAEFTAALVAQNTGGWNRYAQFWERARKTILEKPRAASIRNDEAGPISMGWRLSTWRNPSAYGALVYSKGAYVLHMLRMAMWNPQQGDDAFIAMMREFAAAHAGRNPSSSDFQSIVEKHAPASLRITRDGRLDWFFAQWIHGTAIPKLTSKLDFKAIGDGRYKITGSITQSEVPASFATVVPIYAHFDKTSQARVGTTVLVGSTTKPVDFEMALPKKPQRFSINAMHDVLSR